MNIDTNDTWKNVIAVEEVPVDDVIGVIVDGMDVAIYSVDGDFFASDNLCTHGRARLCDGFLEGHEIECPLHQGKFGCSLRQTNMCPGDRAGAYVSREDRKRLRLRSY